MNATSNSNRTLILLSAMIVATVVVFWPILPEMWTIWLEDSNNSHGLLVPIIVLYLVWIKRDALAAIPTRPSAAGLILIMVALGIYLIALRAQIALPARLALVTTVAGLIWFNLGTAVLRCLGFPLAFSLLMIPMPDSLVGLVTFPLQQFVSMVSAPIIRLIGIPVLREGTMLYFANASLEIAEACSGIRSAASFLTLGILLAYLAGPSLHTLPKMLLVASTLPLALFVNILRVVGTGILAANFGSRVARGFLHEFSGFVVFAVGFVMLWGLTAILRRGDGRRPKSEGTTAVLAEKAA